MLAALAFVPANDVPTYYDLLVKSPFYVKHSSELKAFLMKWEKTWIGRRLLGDRRAPPTFAIQLWNCFDRQLLNLPLTNNAVEGWHNSFRFLVNCQHPSVWRLLEAMKKSNNMQLMRWEQLNANLEHTTTKAKYKARNERIQEIVRNLPDTPPLDFLRAIAHTLRL